MNYAAIKKNDIANGPGVRVSLFVSGCRHHCKNCFNPETWNFSYGEPFDESVENEILSYLDRSYIAGLSLLGGEPFEPENQPALLGFTKKFNEKFPEKTLWCYTGFLLEDILSGKVGDKETALDLLSQIDVLVDGRFIEELKDLSLLFRGSSNQRILNVKKSLEENKAVILEGVWQRKMGSNNIHE